MERLWMIMVLRLLNILVWNQLNPDLGSDKTKEKQASVLMDSTYMIDRL